MTSYTALLVDYARHSGLPESELLANQELVVAGLSVGLMPDGGREAGHEDDQEADGLVMFASLGQPDPQVDRLKLMQLMLEANGMWAGTGGCTLGLQAGTGAVLLCVRLPLAGASGDSLSQAVQSFSSVALLWQQVLQGKVEPELKPHVK